jgi:hypothetical protein
MKDGSGTKVPVQIFHGSCLDMDEQICHFVGIREDQETPSRVPATELPTSVDGGLSPLMEHCTMPMKEAASECSSVSASEPAAEVAVWVDTTTPEYTVARCTMGFSSLCGPSAEGTELLKWITLSQRKRFRGFLQQAFNTFYHECDMDTDELKMEVVLTPTHLKRLKLSVTANVEVAGIEVFGDDDEASQHVLMQLTFSDLSWNQGRTRKRRPHASRERTQATTHSI